MTSFICKLFRVPQSDIFPTFEFHINSKSRDKYLIDDELFSITGSIIFINFSASRELARQINLYRDAKNSVRASELNAMGLLDEIMHYIIETYREKLNPDLLERLEQFMIKQFGKKKINDLIKNFADEFPTSEVYKKKIAVSSYLKGKTGKLSNHHVVMEELIVLWLDNINPAYHTINELIDDDNLETHTVYSDYFRILDQFFKNEPNYGHKNQSLIEMLTEPARKYPHSILAQLDYIRLMWSDYLGDFLRRLLISMDFIREEQKIRFDAGLFGPGPMMVTEFGPDTDFEPEAFSEDLDWMPKVVMIAKSTFVWLDQLSKHYQRSLIRLDQIPDEELDRLAGYGFTALWLIGLWERSIASERIKKMRGNPEAVASAYSLMNYSIAPDLGGEEAYRNLRDRCWRRGIRLASDMVPNHMGIDSDWVINHPDWFIQMDYPPFPTYKYTGEDLSNDERVGIYIEDGYWNNTDAAVVFKRLDKYTGSVRYIYHGNDGTSMPWNDTAQLNYLISEVREAVIQTILHVARMFPIIRFDAAMTLAKKHYQRLWFPQPGTGGDIPSRAEHAKTRRQFDKAFPVEFWREVVDRIQKEVPDTLLLAEAFWMMEGYFVRSLGMHRVYNSAFMNMLKAEENEKFRLSIKNVLEFNPQILKRYVNFMNNPDEETAIAQFGTDDKYFGVCIMMSTLPGLSMFGHGQIEGFREKYGMEYKRAYWEESINIGLVQRHEREIFPLLRKRYLYSDVENFLLYDFYTSDGRVNENVFAYGNRVNDERSLVFYHNKFDRTAGWIHTSAAFLENNQLVQKTLGEGLNIGRRSDLFICFREFISGLEYIRSSEEIWNKGLYIELEAFKYQVLVNFREVQHTAYRPYYDLSVHLNGGGVPSIEAAMDEFIYRPVLNALKECINPGSIKWLVKGAKDKLVLKSFDEKLSQLINTVINFEKLESLTKENKSDIQNRYISSLKLISDKSLGINNISKLNKTIYEDIKKYFSETINEQLEGIRTILILPFIHALKLIYKQDKTLAETFIESRLYDKIIKQSLGQFGMNENLVYQEMLLIKILTYFENGLDIDINNPALPFFEELFNTKGVQHYLQMNEFDGTIYFNKEQFAHLLFWLAINKIIQLALIDPKGITAFKINAMFRDKNTFVKLAEKCGYRGEDFLDRLESFRN